MTLNKKRKNRLLVSLAALVLLGGLAVGGYSFREHQLESRAREGRAEGARLLEQGDHYNALHKIGPYVRRHPDDAAALYNYAVARENVPEPENRHISEAMNLHQRVLSLNPSHAGAAESLLRLYGLVGFTTETIELTDRLLAANPGDPVALRARVEALYRTREFEQAGEFALRMADAAPQDIEAQALALEVIRRLRGGEARILERAEALRERHPGDVRYEVLQSIAFSLVNRSNEARQWALQAAARPMPDMPTLHLLVDRCDRLGLFDQSLALLRSAATGGEADPEVVVALGRRLYQIGQHDELLAMSPSDPSAAEELKVLRTLSLLALDRNPEARQVIATIAPNDESTGSTGAWKPVLEHLSADDRDPVAFMKATRDALVARPADPQLHLAAAEAFAGVGEGEAFVQSLEEAVRLAPAWGEPLLRLGAASLAAGQQDDALLLAEAALQRSGGNADALLLVATARSQQAVESDSAAISAALEAVDRFETAAPDDRRAVPLRVRLLADSNRDEEAVSLVRSILGAKPAVPAQVLLHLSEICRTHDLGLDEDCLRVCEEAHGLLPQLAYVKATRLHEAGRTQEGIDYINAIAAGAPEHARATGAEASEYGVFQARFLEAVRDPAATEAWVTVADANGEDVALQWAALNSPAAQADTAFVARALSRLKERVGDQGINWRVARARWLLQTEPAGTTDGSVQAALILNNVTRESPQLLAPRLLLADALARLGNWNGVVEQLNVASELNPSSVSIALNLAMALQKQGDGLRAVAHLQRVLESPTATLAQRQQAAEIAAAAGDASLAIQAIESAGASGDQAPSDLLLASLYRRTRNFAKVDEICLRLLENPDAASLAFVTNHYLSQGRTAEAQAALAKLDEIELAPADESLIRGDFAARTSNIDAALSHYEEAAKLAPDDTRPWRQILVTLARTGRLEEFAAAAGRAEQALGASGEFRAVAAVAPQADSLSQKWPETGILLATMVEQPTEQAAISAALELLRQADPAAPADAMPRLRKLADEHPNVTPLQILAGRVHLENGQPAVAAQLAGRAMQADPLEPSGARLATVALFAAERWSEAVVAAREWKSRSPGESAVADLLASRSLVQQGNEREAREAVAAYDPADIADPGTRQRMAIHKADLAVRTGDHAGAAALLRPMLAEVQEIRSAWLRLVSGSVRDSQTALAWLREVEPHVSQDGFGGRMSLVDAANAAATRLDTPELKAHTGALLASLNADAAAGSLVADGQMGADHWLLVGMLNEKCGDTASAQAAYRSVLAMNAQHPVAANNLAMLIRESNPDEALRLAKIAAADEGPNRASFLDTLAAVHEQRGELQPALESARQAAELAPESTSIRNRLDRLISAAGQSRGPAGPG